MRTRGPRGPQETACGGLRRVLPRPGTRQGGTGKAYEGWFPDQGTTEGGTGTAQGRHGPEKAPQAGNLEGPHGRGPYVGPGTGSPDTYNHT